MKCPMKLPSTLMAGCGVCEEKNPAPIIGITIDCARNQRISPHTVPRSQGLPGVHE